MKLTQEQVHEFWDTGVLIAKDTLTDADFEPMLKEINAFVDRRSIEIKRQGKIHDLAEEAPFDKRIAILFAQSAEIMNGLDIMHQRGPATFEFLRNKNLLDALESLIGPEIICNPIQHLRAKVPSNSGKGNYELVPWHQDQAVTWEEADVSQIITTWVPLVDATKELGCMEIMPSVSKNGYIEHVSGATIRPDLLPNITPLCAECPKGSVVFMTQLTPHRGLPNISDKARWTIDLRYQKTGTPTGRPFYPAFPVRSRENPSSVLIDHAEWSRRWVKSLEEGKNQTWHRTAKM